MPPEGAACYIVDDDDGVRRSLSLLLSAAGYRVESYQDGDAFLRHAQPDLPFGCVVLDVRMPGSDGVAVQREMVARGMRHPIVFITAHGDVPLAAKMMGAGAYKVLQKPFSGEVLLRITADALVQDH